MAIDEQKIYTMDEAKLELRCSMSTIQRRIRDGRIRAYRLDGKVIIEGSDLLAFLQTRKLVQPQLADF